MFVIWILFELAIEIFGSIFLEMILAVTRVLDEDEGAKVPSAFLLSMVGVVLGALSVVLAPSRLFSSRLLPGAKITCARSSTATPRPQVSDVSENAV